jgi:hypothetical protein
MCPKETIRFVTVVPMFAPITIGIAPATGKSPAPTSATTIEVVAEEDWMMLVTSIPKNNPTNGLAVECIKLSAKSLPISLNPKPKSLMLKRKK